MSGSILPTPTLYEETRLSITPPSPTTLLNIEVGDSKSFVHTGAGRKRAFREISGLDEESYARTYLATAGSVFFRPASRAPRSFLWRVLNERHTLELQCVDLVEDKRHHGNHSWITFHICLPKAIVPDGVALADGGAKDALVIFMITSDGLYTVTLKRDLLARESVPADFDGSSVTKHFPLGHKAYRLTAVSSLELLVSLEDGGFLRLQRQPNELGNQWRPTYFSEGGWSGTLKGIVPTWSKNRVRHGELDLMHNALAAMAMSPDGKYVWTVGLDHVLKAWSTATGRVTVQMDLLAESRTHEDRKKQALMDAGQGTLVQIADPQGVPGVAYFLVCYSPHGHHFKFYAVSSNDEKLDIRDAQPRSTSLVAPVADMLGTTVWHLEHFHVVPGHTWRKSQIWIRARNGALCQTFTLTFDLLDETWEPIDLTALWKSEWIGVEDYHLSIEALRSSPDFAELDGTSCSSLTPSEKWLTFLFYPGRFSEATLEAALSIYRKGRGLPVASSKSLTANEPVKERITSAVAANILLRRGSNDHPDYDRYQLDLQVQWQTFFTLLSHLHTLRLAPIGFAYDDVDDLPWSVRADFVAPIRTSSGFELVSNNADYLRGSTATSGKDAIHRKIWPNMDEDVLKSQVLAVAKQLRLCLSPRSQEKLRRAAIADALDQSVDKSAMLALQGIYEECGISEEISNEDFDAISEAASVFNGLGSLDDDCLLMILEAIDADVPLHGTDSGRALQNYGKELNIAIAQQTLQHAQSVLLDVLALVIFMHGDLEAEELDNNFRPNEMYDSIIFRFKLTELRLWLVSHVRAEPKKAGGNETDVLSMTIYESLFIGDWQSLTSKAHRSMAHLITAWAKSWTLGIDLNANWTGLTDYIMADLIKHAQYALAQDFVKFLPENAPWATYLKGRVQLATNEYGLASSTFVEVAEELSQLPDAAKVLGDSLLTDKELEHFGQGLTPYYQHISALFESQGAFSYTAEHSYTAFQYLQAERDLMRELHELDLRKSKNGPESPAPQRIDDAMEEIRLLRLREARDGILGRLYNALSQCGRFEEAYQALEQMTHPELRKSNMRLLVGRCVREDAVPVLLSLPVTGDLVQTIDAELLRLAKRSMGTSNTQLSGPPYHQILFAFRTRHSDFRGAAALLYTHLEYLKHTNAHAVKDPDDETLPQAYVLLINTLMCCGGDEAWLLADAIDGVHPAGTKRRLVRLEDVRREYAEELDRRSEVQLGRFAIVGGDEMDMF
ncbi:hypothetical protein CERZMDRAFT_114014 [Cercospora zeae-maydis SCOH1-5]|uniref:Uncharacterized protein n=1 Tax=Cercospora zeae-maydis SCOH1-5 TaxID=717836 RepID=A0A6A6F8F4_9PEZI|nr:hypothetical protein CERZMDRAFT_114014 [Cercospora zeae-maydis SCOH1-5]